MKRQPSEWEKIIANEATDKQLISIIYKQLLQLNSRKINDQIKKWRRLLRVPWIARRSNQSTLKEINLEYSLKGLKLELKL